jgi:hypothetical protein
MAAASDQTPELQHPDSIPAGDTRIGVERCFVDSPGLVLALRACRHRACRPALRTREASPVYGSLGSSGGDMGIRWGLDTDPGIRRQSGDSAPAFQFCVPEIAGVEFSPWTLAIPDHGACIRYAGFRSVAESAGASPALGRRKRIGCRRPGLIQDGCMPPFVGPRIVM